MSQGADLEALVLRVQQGDQEAFQELFYETHLLARKVAVAVVGPQNVDDAIQESYLLVYRKLPQLQDPGAFRGWLSRLVLHVCYRMNTKVKETAELEEEQSQAPDASQTVVDSLFLRQGLMRLKQAERDILVLRELLGLTYEETAFALKLKVGTVRSRLHAARKHLAERLKLSSIQ